MKMKVSKEKLETAIKKHVLDAQKEYEKKLEQYSKKLEAAQDRHLQNVEQYLQRIKSNPKGMLDSYKLRDVLDKGVDVPSEPREPQQHKETLLKLSLCIDDVVTVDDRSEYMKILDGRCTC